MKPLEDFEIEIAVDVYDVETGKWLVKYNGVALSDATIHAIMEDVEKKITEEGIRNE